MQFFELGLGDAREFFEIVEMNFAFFVEQFAKFVGFRIFFEVLAVSEFGLNIKTENLGFFRTKEARAAVAGVPVAGVPVAGVPAAGVPVVGVPVAGVPVAGVPAAGVPVAGVPAAGVPAAGVPVAGVPAAGVPAAGVPVAGVPAAGVPVAGGFTSAIAWRDLFDQADALGHELEVSAGFGGAFKDLFGLAFKDASIVAAIEGINATRRNAEVEAAFA